VAKQIFSNGSSSTLAVSIDGTDTTIQVQSGYGAAFPSPSGGNWFLVTLEDVDANVEVVRCTARSGDLLTVVRAQEGTVAQEFANTTTRVELRNTKGSMERFFQRSGDTMGADLDLGGFELVNGALGADVTVPSESIFPVGMIVLWSGSIASVPEKWALCNGANGTPDLRNRFVVGAGGDYAVAATGGANSVTPTTGAAGAHDHGAATGGTTLTTAQMPSHSHTLSTRGSNASSQGNTQRDFPRSYNEVGATLVESVETEAVGGGESHNHSITAAVDHTHTVSAVDTRSPYYALAYIMYTG
jgi:microcystin-dependent protein